MVLLTIIPCLLPPVSKLDINLNDRDITTKVRDLKISMKILIVTMATDLIRQEKDNILGK